MKAVAYEIERWIEIRFQRAKEWPNQPQFSHGDRWYIWNDVTEEYFGPGGRWFPSCMKFFETPEAALEFWTSTKGARKLTGADFTSDARPALAQTLNQAIDTH